MKNFCLLSFSFISKCVLLITHWICWTMGTKELLFFLIRGEKNGPWSKNQTNETLRCWFQAITLSFWCPGRCGPPPNLYFASLTTVLNETYFDTGTKLKYTCRPGFSNVNFLSPLVTCQHDTWRYSEFCTSKYEHLFFLFMLFPSLQGCLRN